MFALRTKMSERLGVRLRTKIKYGAKRIDPLERKKSIPPLARQGYSQLFFLLFFLHCRELWFTQKARFEGNQVCTYQKLFYKITCCSKQSYQNQALSLRRQLSRRQYLPEQIIQEQSLRKRCRRTGCGLQQL